MKKFAIICALGGSMALGGCASYGGLGGGAGQSVLGSVLGSVLNTGGNGGYYGQGGPSLQEAAIEGCAIEANRYGRAGVTDVRQQDSNTLRVFGTIDTNYQRRAFACSFRSDGRITDFDVQ